MFKFKVEWTEEQVKQLVNSYTMKHKGVHGVFPTETEVMDFVQCRTQYPPTPKDQWNFILRSMGALEAFQLILKVKTFNHKFNYVKSFQDFLRYMDGIEVPTPVKEEMYAWSKALT